jgi:Tfp pilus assembly protein FimV
MSMIKHYLTPILLLVLCAPAAWAQTTTPNSQNAAIDEALITLLGNADINDFLQVRRSEEIRGGFYQVRTGDSLDQLLERIYGSTVIRRDILRDAMISANPHAFRNNNPNWILAGAQLRIPGADDVMGLIFRDTESVRTRIRGGNPNWVKYP